MRKGQYGRKRSHQRKQNRPCFTYSLRCRLSNVTIPKTGILAPASRPQNSCYLHLLQADGHLNSYSKRSVGIRGAEVVPRGTDGYPRHQCHRRRMFASAFWPPQHDDFETSSTGHPERSFAEREGPFQLRQHFAELTVTHCGHSIDRDSRSRCASAE